MASISQVTVADLRTTAQDQESALDSATTNLQQLQGECESLRAAWQGHASSIYLGAMDTFQEEAQSVLNLLRNMQQTMLQTAAHFGTTTDNIATAASGVTSRIHGPSGLPGL